MSEQVEKVEKKPTDNLKVDEYGIFKLLVAPFRIYFRQFFQMFTISLIPELLIFGIFYLVLINLKYNFISHQFIFSLDFRNEYVTPYLIPLIIVAVLLFILRSSIITNLCWKTVEKSKANVFWAIDLTGRRFKELFFASLMLIGFLAIPALIFIFGILFNARVPFVSWIMLVISVGFPILLGSKISLFVVAINKEELSVGRAFQRSFDLTRSSNWLKTTMIVGIYAFVSIILPWALTNTFIEMTGDWMGIIMIFVRAALYPLFDCSLTLTYLNNDYDVLQHATFRDEIIKQREKSEEMKG